MSIETAPMRENSSAAGQSLRLPVVSTRDSHVSAIWRLTPRLLRAFAVALSKRLCNEASANRTAAALLLTYAVLWAISAMIRNLGISLHGDMIKAYALAQHLSLGYIEQPPLINWIT